MCVVLAWAVAAQSSPMPKAYRAILNIGTTVLSGTGSPVRLRMRVDLIGLL